MARKAALRPQFDDATIRACGDLLRDLQSPGRFRANPLVARLPHADRDATIAFVQAALRQLTPREREIVVRCDIEGEPYVVVAASINVSERHLFRERRSALARIAHAFLEQDAPARPPAIGFIPDALTIRLATADALERSGEWRAAGEMLEQLSAEVGNEQRATIAIRLARLYRDSNQFPRARRHADIAATLAKRQAPDDAWRRAEADIALAAVTACSGDWQAAAPLAERGVTFLRAWTGRNADARITNALVDGLTVQAQVAETRGDEAMFGLLREACDVVATNDAVERRIALTARWVAATANLLADRDSERSEHALWECHRDALSWGLARDALIVAANLSSHYRSRSQPALARQLVAPLVGAARAVGTGWVRTAVLSELAYANLATGALDAAAQTLTELSESASGNPESSALARITSGDVHLARREFAQAADEGAAAESAFRAMGLQRTAATALRLQAEALAALGQSDRAWTAITRAADMFKETGYPRRLAGAYRVMARISGRERYAIAARRIMREIDAPSA